MTTAMQTAKRRHRGYDRAGWRGPHGLRLRVLRRDGFRCQFGFEGCTGQATSVHIAPILGGDHRKATMDTCTSTCHSCHGRVDGGRSFGGRRRSRFFRRAPTIPADVATFSPGGGTGTPNRFLTAIGRRPRP